MKNFKHLLFITISFLSLNAYAQTNRKTLNYQAVILDPKAIDIPGASITGQPLNKGNVCLRFSLLNATGGLDYEETQQVTTDEFGLVSVAIGTGSQAQAGNSTSVYKSFDSVVWNASVKSLKVSVSYDGCSSFKQVSTQSFNYTPYALYAEAVDYKNVREAPTKLSQFSNDEGFLIPKDLDPLKTDIQGNSSKIATANQNIADNKQASEAAFLVVNQSISSLDKQVASNTSSITTINTKITDQQNQISDNRNQIAATNSTMNAQIGGLQGQLNITNNTVSNLTGVAEMQSNKSTAVDLGGANPSDQAYPSQKAAKAYVDQVVSQIATTGVPDATTLAAGKVQLAGDLGGTATNPTVPALASKANIASPAFSGVPTAPTPASSDNSTKIATTAFVQAATAGIVLQAEVDAKANIASPAFTGTPTAPTPTLGDNSTKLATTAYVDAQVSAGAADASTSSKGIVKLSGDLGGTATSPTVPGLLLKEDVSNKSDAALGTSTTLYPTQNAVKTYVDAQVASATIVDADATTKGKIQLTGDLGGTASSPTVPGLVLKAPIESPTFTGTVGGISKTMVGLANVDNTADAAKPVSTAAQSALDLKEDASNKSDAALGTSTTLYPTQNAVKTYVDAQVASATIVDADATTKGKIQLTGDLGGTASSPTVPGLVLKAPIESPTFTGTVGGISKTMVGLANVDNTADAAKPVSTAAQSALDLKENASNKSDAALGTSTTLYPTQNAVKTYVDAQVASATIVDADATTKGKIQLTGDLAGSASSPSVVKLRGTPISSVAPATAGHVLTYDVSGSATWAAPANSANTISGVVPVANGGTGLSSLTSGGAVYASSSSALTTGTLPLTAGGTGVTSQQAAINALTGTQTAGRYLRSDGTDARLTSIQVADVPTLNQNTTGTAANVTGTVAVANGGTGLTSTPTDGQIDIGNGSGFTRTTLTAGTAITITNTSGAITISAAIRPTSDEFTATAGQTAFTLSQTPITNTTTSPVKPNVWMFINGVRTKNLAYAVSGTSVTYTASSNNSYTLVAGDRIQFDYAY